jgi:hypothetical protein
MRFWICGKGTVAVNVKRFCLRVLWIAVLCAVCFAVPVSAADLDVRRGNWCYAEVVYQGADAEEIAQGAYAWVVRHGTDGARVVIFGEDLKKYEGDGISASAENGRLVLSLRTAERDLYGDFVVALKTPLHPVDTVTVSLPDDRRIRATLEEAYDALAHTTRFYAPYSAVALKESVHTAETLLLDANMVQADIDATERALRSDLPPKQQTIRTGGLFDVFFAAPLAQFRAMLHTLAEPVLSVKRNAIAFFLRTGDKLLGFLT